MWRSFSDAFQVICLDGGGTLQQDGGSGRFFVGSGRSRDLYDIRRRMEDWRMEDLEGGVLAVVHRVGGEEDGRSGWRSGAFLNVCDGEREWRVELLLAGLEDLWRGWR